VTNIVNSYSKTVINVLEPYCSVHDLDIVFSV
jgi:hypothetical protein